jgi:hypothetical protein
MPLPEGAHLDLLREAIATEGRAQRALLAGEDARADLLAASDLYRRSWEVAPPESYGRLIGVLKAAVLAGDAADAAAYARVAVPVDAHSPPARYAVAIAALVDGDREAAGAAAAGMRAGSDAFNRAAAAIEAIVAGDADAYAQAIRAIVEDFEAREKHLTGVPIADTALMLERLAGDLAAHPASPLLPTPARR